MGSPVYPRPFFGKLVPQLWGLTTETSSDCGSENVSRIVVPCDGPISTPSTSNKSRVVTLSHSWWCGRPLVAKLGVGTVAGKVSQLPTLVAAQVGVIATSHTATSYPGPSLGHLDAAVAYCNAISLLEGTVSILLVGIHHKGKTRRVAGHPDLPQPTILLKHSLKVSFAGVHIQFSYMESSSINRCATSRP